MKMEFLFREITRVADRKQRVTGLISIYKDSSRCKDIISQRENGWLKYGELVYHNFTVLVPVFQSLIQARQTSACLLFVPDVRVLSPSECVTPCCKLLLCKSAIMVH